MIISGSITDLFVHCTALGLAAIVQDETKEEVDVRWIDQRHVEVDSCMKLNDEAIAALVKEQAMRISESAWLNTDVQLPNDKDPGKQVPKSPLSPRVAGKINRSNYRMLNEARCKLFDSMGSSSLASILFAGNLGRPAYWAFSQNGKQQENRPDAGATYWEMSDRRRGDDFVRCRLRELAQVVAARCNEEVAGGITGTFCSDERAKKNLIESTTATGLRAKGETDNVQAWCALWAMTLFPTRPVVSPNSAVHSNTVGAFCIHRSHVYFCMPVFEGKASLDRVRGVLRTSALYRTGAQLVDKDEMIGRGATEMSLAMDESQLNQLGVAGVVVFPRKAVYVGNTIDYWAEEGSSYSIVGSKRAR